MGFLKKLFGGTAKPESSKAPTKTASPVVIYQEDTGPPLRIVPGSISHAFLALTHADVAHSQKLDGDIANFNRRCQPRLWNVQFKTKFVMFAAEALKNGFPDIASVEPTLEGVGLTPPYSIVVNTMTILVEGRTPAKILVGFAYRDHEPKIILPRTDGCIPA